MDEELEMGGADAQDFEELFDFVADGDGADQPEDGAAVGQENPEGQGGADQPAEDQAGGEGERETPDAAADGEPEAQEPGEQETALRYMDQTVRVPPEQLKELAQKGLDYERVRQERDSLKNSRERQLMTKYAAVSGMELPAYLDYLESALEGAAVKRETDAGMSEAQAKELLRLRQSEAERRAAQQAEAKQKEQNAQYVALLREYPDVQELPPEVVHRIAEGETPLAAYRAYDLARTKAALEAEKAAQKAKAAAQRNRETAPGSAVGIGGKDKADKFLEGFESGFIY